MLTITALAKQAKLSRTAILYYEREELLQPATRGSNGYRLYGEKELQRLLLISSYRSLGVPVSEIHQLLSSGGNQQQVLQKQLTHLEQEIQHLRQQQRAIITFLEQPELQEDKMVTKERWTQIMRASGMTDEDMQNWHIQFEKLEPEAHQEFLESLQIDPAEIQQIRAFERS
ncbi:MAG: MerR family transcriptional regulator [Amphritea sp.]